MINDNKHVNPLLLEIDTFADSVDGVLADLPQKTLLDIGLDMYEQDFAEGTPLLHIKGTEMFDIENATKAYNALCALAENTSLPDKFRAMCHELKSASAADAEFASNAVIDALERRGSQNPLSDYFAWRSAASQIYGMREKIAKWSSGAWNREYCPICGAEPVSARLKKSAKGTVRYLHCGSCATEWEFKRIGCPYCGNEAQESLGIFEVENEDSLRVDYCVECSSYIKTYTGDDERGAFDDLKTLHVDMLCGDTKYKKRGGFFAPR